MKINPITFSFTIAISIAFFFLVVTFYIFDTSSPASLKDALSTTGSYFGATATLGAAILAAYLFNDWRDEKNYDLEQTYLSNIISNLKPIHYELLKIRSDAFNLKKIDKNFIVKTEYLTRSNLDLFDAIIKCYPDIKIYSEITKDLVLPKLYKKIEHHCLCLAGFYDELFNVRYKEYYNKVLHDNIDHGYEPNTNSYNIFRPYNSTTQRQELLTVQIHNLTDFFGKNRCHVQFENNIYHTTFEIWLDETISLHDEIIDHCINHLKPSK